MQKKQSKILILHDTFLYKWGWERLILMMAKALNADIASGFFSAWSFDLRKEWFKWKLILVSIEIFKKWFRHIRLKKDFMYNTKFLSYYDTVIFSWDCLWAVRNLKEGTKSIYYCHTPPRYLYDLRDEYLKKVPFYLKFAFNFLSSIFRKMYESDIKKIDLILTNSKTTQSRLKSFIWYDSKVLYPPVNLKEFKWVKQDDYYLSYSRLSTAKRIDNIVRAFTKMPDKKLKVIYWTNDPQKDEIFEIAKWFPNIEFKTLPWNIWLTDIVWSCIANICIPINEDFWMISIEAMAAWKPCIWVNEWGLRETVIDKKTGVLIPEWGEVEDLIKAIEYMTPERALEMRDNCEKQARNFSLDEFERQIRDYIK